MRVQCVERQFDWQFDWVFDWRARLPSMGQGGMMHRVLLLSPDVMSCRAMKKSVCGEDSERVS